MVYGVQFAGSLEHIERILTSIVRQDEAQLPPCIANIKYNCDECTLAYPDNCLISSNWEIGSYLRYIIDRELRLRKTIQLVISEHGRPLYQDIIASMVQARDSSIPNHAIYAWLDSCSVHFKAFGFNIYGLSEWHTE